MSLSILPPEVLSIIVENLDTRSIFNLHRSGLVTLQGLVTEYQFSKNMFATAKVLETNFFRDTSRNLRVLNLSCVMDLDCPTLLGAIRYLPKLTDLDVSYTKILMPDFLRLVDMAPTLTTIAINFSFGEDYNRRLRRFELLEYQEAFRPFQKVTLISYPSVIHEVCKTKLALLMLRKAPQVKLRFEFGNGPAIDRYELDYEDRERVSLSEIQLHRLRSNGCHDLPIFDLINFSKYEVAIFKTGLSEHHVRNQWLFVTPFLKQFIPASYHVQVEVLMDFKDEEYSEGLQYELDETYGLENAFLFWEKSRTKFDESFYPSLCKILQEYTVFSCKSPYLRQIAQAPTPFHWYSIHHIVPPDALKRNKVFEINYGFAFKQHVDVKLNLKLDYIAGAVPRMVNNFNFLSKLSHLSLTSAYNYDAPFFKSIFEGCVKLETLQMIGGDSFDPMILQDIGLSKSLKNLLIQSVKRSLITLFALLSECRSLENICIFIGTLALPNPIEIFKNCKNLYNFTIYSGFGYKRHKYPTKECKERYFKAFAVIKRALGRHSINMGICEYSQFIHNPFTSVFSIFQLEPV